MAHLRVATLYSTWGVREQISYHGATKLVSTVDRVSSLRAQLGAHAYDVRAGELVRVRADPNDDLVSGVIRAVVAEGEQGCDAFRRGLSEGEVDVLRMFVMRRTLQGQRQSSLGLLYEAIDGCALMSTPLDVPWDTWLRAAFYFAESLGGDLNAIGRRFGDLADADVAARCDVALEAMNRVSSLSQCRLVEVRTNYGVGLVELLVFRDNTHTGFSRAPKLGSNQIAYEPDTNLAQLAASLADALDATSTVECGPITQDQLAATSFAMKVSGSYLPTKGCLSFIVDSVNGGDSYTVLVAELTDDTDGDELVAAANDTDDQRAIHDARRLVLFSPQPNFDDDVDVVINFDDEETLARVALNDHATR